MQLRGHALVWGQEGSNVNALQPSHDDYGCESVGSVTRTGCQDWTADEKRTIIVEHITEHMTRYNGSITVYDVVNEAVCDCISWDGSKFSTCEEYVATDDGATKCGYSDLYNAYLKRNVFWPDVPDYIGLSFQTAATIDPNAILGYNEYKFEADGSFGSNGGFLSEKGRSVYNLIKALKDQGVPIHYVGSQTHINLDYLNYGSDDYGYIDSVKNYSKSIVDLDVEWHFTEVTVGLASANSDGYMTDDEQQNQATLYTGLVEVCMEIGVEKCPMFQVRLISVKTAACFDNN